MFIYIAFLPTRLYNYKDVLQKPHNVNKHNYMKMWFFALLKGVEKMSFIEVKNISKTFKVPVRNAGLKETMKSFFHRKYNYVHAVKDISFTIERGEIIGVLRKENEFLKGGNGLRKVLKQKDFANLDKEIVKSGNYQLPSFSDDCMKDLKVIEETTYNSEDILKIIEYQQKMYREIPLRFAVAGHYSDKILKQL